MPKPSMSDRIDSSHQLSQNLLLLLPFVDGGGSVVTDFSGLDNHGTITNLGGNPWLADNGGALQFNGAGYVDHGNINPALFGGDFTVIGQVSTVAGSIPTEFIVGKEVGEGTGFAFFTRSTQAAYEIRISGGLTGPKIQAGTNSAIPQTWQRVVVTRNGPTVSFYIDGVLANSGAFNHNGSTISTLRVGATSWTTVFASTGKMSDIRVYDRGFDASDVALDFSDPWSLIIPEIILPPLRKAGSSLLRQLQNRVYIRLATELGSFVYNPTIGSELHLLMRSKNLSEVHDLVEDYVRAALKPEIKRGFLLGIENVRVLEKTQSTVKIEVDVIANNQRIVTIPLEVGS